MMMLEGSKSGYEMDGGISIVSGGSCKTGIAEI